MKFGKLIRSEQCFVTLEWERNFVRYKDLKKEIKRISIAQIERDPDYVLAFHEQFQVALLEECQKVDNFYMLIGKHMQLKLHELQNEVDAMRSGFQMMAFAQKRQAKSKIVSFYTDLRLLQRFAQINCEGFRKITKKYDKKTGSNTQNSFMSMLKEELAFACQAHHSCPFDLVHMLTETQELYCNFSSRSQECVQRKFELISTMSPYELQDSAQLESLSKKEQEERKAENQRVIRHPLLFDSDTNHYPPLIPNPGIHPNIKGVSFTTLTNQPIRDFQSAS